MWTISLVKMQQVLIKFIDQQDRRGVGTGSYISAYEVEVMGGFGKYASIKLSIVGFQKLN